MMYPRPQARPCRPDVGRRHARSSLACGSGDDDSAASHSDDRGRTEPATTPSVRGTAATGTTASAPPTRAGDHHVPRQPELGARLREDSWPEQFEAETGIHVDYQIIPADQYFSVLQTKLEAGGEGIDIFGGQSGKSDIELQLDVEKNAVPADR